MQRADEIGPRKRLRLGTTRSCFECRRRRVRCSVLKPGQACQACLLHDTPCRPQEPPSDQQNKSTVGNDNEAGLLRQRLAEIELQVQSLLGTLNIQRNATAQNDLKGQLQQQGQNSTFSQDVEALSQSVDTATLEYSNSAPLMSFIGDAMTIHAIKENHGQSAASENSRLQDLLRELRPLLPDSRGLRYILTETEPYWSIWPSYHFTLPNSEQAENNIGVEAAMRFIPEALHSMDTFENVKAILWLSLCIQQISQKWNTDTAAGSAKYLVKTYMRIANVILSINAEEDIHSITEIECRILQQVLLINQGKPHKAWLTTRSATNSASLQGFHCLPSKTEILDKETEHKRSIWDHVCQADILLSLFLGLPVASRSSNLPMIERNKFSTFDTRFIMMREMFRIANAVAERNQSNQFQDYSITLQLDREFSNCCSMMPIDWWNSIFDENIPLPIVYQTQRMKILIGLIGKHIHLPFLIKGRSDVQFNQSRDTVFQQCKRIIDAYVALRVNKSTRFVMCELMDFQAFGAALTIAVELLSSPFNGNQDQLDQWQMVSTLSSILRHTSIDLECTVASQSANVLDTLYSVYQHPESAFEFDAEIPYFGKIRIAPITNHRLSLATSSSSSSSIYESPLVTATPVFSADLFYPLSSYQDFQPSIMDLHSDWTTFDFARSEDTSDLKWLTEPEQYPPFTAY